ASVTVSPPASVGTASALAAESAAELVGRVSTLTAIVADDVEQHSGSIQTLNDELAAVQFGDSAAVATVIHKLLLANQEMQGRLDQAELKLQAHQRQLQNVASVARTDGLTGLLNRRSLDEQL